MNALLLEDDIDTLDVTCEYLQCLNLTIKKFSFPSKALRALEKEQFDLIFTDIILPEMDGFEFAYQVRAMGVNSHIIAITGLPDYGEVLLKSTDGKNRLAINHILLKPVEYEEIEKVVSLFASPSTGLST